MYKDSIVTSLNLLRCKWCGDKIVNFTDSYYKCLNGQHKFKSADLDTFIDRFALYGADNPWIALEAKYHNVVFV